MKKRYSEVAWLVDRKFIDKEPLPILRTYQENGYTIKVYPPCFGPEISTTVRRNATSSGNNTITPAL